MQIKNLLVFCTCSWQTTYRVDLKISLVIIESPCRSTEESHESTRSRYSNRVVTLIEKSVKSHPVGSLASIHAVLG